MESQPHSAPTHSAEDSRRRELGAFLRSRRERLSPSATGIATGLRRRRLGLRREEVAMIAGVGTTWYTWLEQGRDVRPSVEVLTSLCRALQLDAAEKRHLFILAGRQQPERRAATPEKVDGPLLHMLQSLVLQPAYVVGRRWDVLAWNPAAVAVFGDYGLLEGDARNIVHMVFASPHHRRLLVDWEELARVVLASFRAESAKYVGDPDFDRLAVAHIRQLGLLEIGNHVDRIQRHHGHQLRSGLHKLSDPHRPRANRAVNRRGHLRVRQVQLGLLLHTVRAIGLRHRLRALGGGPSGVARAAGRVTGEAGGSADALGCIGDRLSTVRVQGRRRGGAPTSPL